MHRDPGSFPLQDHRIPPPDASRHPGFDIRAASELDWHAECCLLPSRTHRAFPVPESRTFFRRGKVSRGEFSWFLFVKEDLQCSDVWDGIKQIRQRHGRFALHLGRSGRRRRCRTDSFVRQPIDRLSVGVREQRPEAATVAVLRGPHQRSALADRLQDFARLHRPSRCRKGGVSAMQLRGVGRRR